MIKLAFFIGILFVLSFQPVFIVRMLIFITFLYSYMIYIKLGTFWFRYVLLMVMIRGVLVIFTYIVSLVPNESFEIYGLVILFFLIRVFIITLSNFYNIENFEYITINLWITYIRFLRLFLVGFLLGIILLVVILGHINNGALRAR